MPPGKMTSEKPSACRSAAESGGVLPPSTMRDVNARQFGAEFLFRDGAYRPAGIGKGHNEPEHECDRKCGNKADHA